MTYWDFMATNPVGGIVWTFFLFVMAAILVMLLPGSWGKK